MVKVFVGRVPTGLSSERLREMFEKYGTVTECNLVKDYAFVHMDSEQAAESAIKAYHNLNIEGGVLTVEKSHGRPSKGRDGDRGGGRGGGMGRRDGRGDDRRDGGRGGFRDRSPIDRRRDDFGRGGDYGRGGGGDRYAGGYGGGRGGPGSDPGAVYGDRGFGGRGPAPSAYYDPRAPPAPSSYGYNDPYARRSPPPVSGSRYGSGYAGGGSYGGPPAYNGGGGGAGEYGGAPSNNYDNYDRYSAPASYSRDGARGYGSASGAPAAGVTRRY